MEKGMTATPIGNINEIMIMILNKGSNMEVDSKKKRHKLKIMPTEYRMISTFKIIPHSVRSNLN
jgi:hypothetical protein